VMRLEVGGLCSACTAKNNNRLQQPLATTELAPDPRG
jgi:hypothetical protein